MKKTYKGVTLDFLLKGGDLFSKVIEKTYKPRNINEIGDFR